MDVSFLKKHVLLIDDVRAGGRPRLGFRLNHYIFFYPSLDPFHIWSIAELDKPLQHAINLLTLTLTFDPENPSLIPYGLVTLSFKVHLYTVKLSHLTFNTESF